MFHCRWLSKHWSTSASKFHQPPKVDHEDALMSEGSSARVARTAHRPLASGHLKPKAALLFFALQAGLAFLILLLFNWQIIRKPGNWVFWLNSGLLICCCFNTIMKLRYTVKQKHASRCCKVYSKYIITECQNKQKQFGTIKIYKNLKSENVFWNNIKIDQNFKSKNLIYFTMMILNLFFQRTLTRTNIVNSYRDKFV